MNAGAEQLVSIAQATRLGFDHWHSGRVAQAERVFSRILKTDPVNGDALNMLGVIALRAGRSGEALASLEAAARVQPENAFVHNNLAETYKRAGRANEAESEYRRAIALKPDYAEARANLGNLLADLGRFGEAELCFREALTVKPGDPHLTWNFALQLLRKGDYAEGLRLYERRFQAADRKALGAAVQLLEQLAVCRRWAGEPLAGDRLLVWTEQGLGDTLMMMRYFARLKELGAGELIVYCEETLVRVMKAVPAVDRVVSRRGPLPFGEFDLHVPIMSLPLLVDPRLDAAMLRAPSFAVPDTLARNWRARLSGVGPIRVGLNWASGRLSTVGALRDIPLTCFAPLLALRGIAFVSLQKGEEVCQLRESGWPVVDLMDHCRDLMDTAALISQLDLVVSCDTMVPHLAGALGKPVWLLNRFESDWRWMRGGREANGWYPTMQLFTQQRRGDWDGVIARVALELGRWVPRLSGDRNPLEAALVHHRAGRLRDAAALYDEILSAEPAHPDALNLRGVVAHQLGESRTAVELISRAVRLEPGNAHYSNNLGEAYRALKLLRDACDCFRRAVELNPDYAEAHSNLGDALRALGQPSQAEASYRRALELNPSLAIPVRRLGELLAAEGRMEEALGFAERRAAAEPGSAEAQYQLAELFRMTGRTAQGQEAYRAAIAARSDHAEAHNSLGALLRELGRHEEAVQCYARALSSNAEFAEAHNNMGNALKELGRLREADASFMRALQLRPGWPTAELNRALLLLLLGDYARGFPLYESRFRAIRDGVPILALPIARKLASLPRCASGDLQDKRILVWSEQGFGDTIMMMRYLPLIKANGAGRVVVHCQPQLARLVQRLPEVDEVVTRAGALDVEQFDCHVPFMSLPLLFGTTIQTIPARVPYLEAPNDMCESWAMRLSAMPGRKVGLVWAGQPKLHDDAKRSIALRRFAPLAAVEGVTFVSLQKDAAARALKQSDGRIFDGGGECRDFLDTAALVSCVDLVIGVDTAVVHLAGALGTPVWLLNRYESEWRWMLDRDDSPWYPTLRIVRQKTRGDWDEVLERVASCLAEGTHSL